ncbi:DUF3558 family protein [Gordonia polyisoprenivorans]|uniref:DUF3558 domain-containing protein n=1 Tax=Gordonia polyisoprenivorans TaxID=84595 RepID=A0A846WHF8_9ACTN|nr:DUF3558 family protein [Gordonia polyisoprenivorans]NKY00489.1 DUF3558 domain-containing protein [Gordonia polyisoprenivorans]
MPGVIHHLTLIGCSTQTTGTIESTNIASVTAQSTIRQTDSSGTPLPFVTKFKDRWSDLNDGSPYEPCTALTEQELLSIGLAPDSVDDVALADHQTARGCLWRFSNSPTSNLSQDVGNYSSLARYKEEYASTIDWQPDLFIDGRMVAIGIWLGQKSCVTNVQSGTAIVTTSVAVVGAPLSEKCAKAIAFTKATIDKMPP